MAFSSKTRNKNNPLAYRLPAGLLSAGLIIALILPNNAMAQPRTLFDMLFGEKKAPPPPKPSIPSKKTPRSHQQPLKRTPASPRKPSAAQIPIPIPAPKHLVEKLEDANNILVLGDFLSSGLADGLMDAFSDNPSVRISNLSNGSSGFVRQDYYNWNQSITTLLEQEKPAAVVMMIGANDRQPISLSGKHLNFQNDEWIDEYHSRVENFIQTIKTAGYPLIWVGQPPYLSHSMSKDMLALNEIYRSTSEKAEAYFVDIWDGFADEDGHALITGLDINGQQAQLRSPDGIGLTTAGKRKLAFYVEKPLRNILSATEQADKPAAFTPSENNIGIPARIERIPAVNLRDYDADYSGVLLGSAPVAAKSNTSKHNIPYSPYPERADYFRSNTNK